MTNHTAAQPLDLDKLEALAREATPGPWAATHWNCHAATTVMRSGTSDVVAETTGFGRDATECATDSAFIAAANPVTILALIALARRAAPDTTASASAIAEHAAWPGLRLRSAAQPVQAGEAVDERALFEAWHRSKFATKHSTGQPTRDMHNGIYDENYGPKDQQLMWEVWQARASLAPVAAQQGAAKAPAAQAVDAQADEIVTALYRRFKDWSKRGFGPDDVTWCEVKADVLALIAASPASTLEAAHADDDLDHGETLLRVQGLLGITQTGWVSPDLIELRINQLWAAAHAQQPAAPGEPLLWALVNLNNKVVFSHESRATVEYNQPYIKTPTRVVGLSAAPTAGAATTSDSERLDLLLNISGFHFEIIGQKQHLLDARGRIAGIGATKRAAIDAALRATQQEGGNG